MNAHEAALLAWQLAPRIVYPNHFGMWAPEHYGRGATLDPALFTGTYQRLGGTGVVRIPAVGVREHLEARQVKAATPD
jgi:L-ascorbate metabolism protein UlaG (beta-lactamase superfamily)